MPKAQKVKYLGASVSIEVKTQTAHYAVNLQRAGVPLKVLIDALDGTFYVPSKSTLIAIMSRIKRGEDAFENSMDAGRPPSLSTKEWEIVAGWILQCDKEVDFDKVRKWIEEYFGKSLSKATISRFLTDYKLSVQLSGKRHMKSKDERVYAQGYYDFLVELYSEDFFNFDPSLIIAFDFITNSRRLEQRKTIGMLGGKQKKYKGSSPIFTDSYMIPAAMADGLGLQAIMFSKNPIFVPNGPDAEEVLSWCQRLNINRDRIVYDDDDGVYCAESQSMVSHFQGVYRKKLKGIRVMHDKGGSFIFEKEYILADGADRVKTMPADQHGEFSVLDNKVNAVVKALWRKERTNENFAYDSVLLLNCIDRAPQADTTKYWRKNYMMGKGAPSKVAVEKMLREGTRNNILREVRREQYLEAYHQRPQELA